MKPYPIDRGVIAALKPADRRETLSDALALRLGADLRDPSPYAEELASHKLDANTIADYCGATYRTPMGATTTADVVTVAEQGATKYAAFDWQSRTFWWRDLAAQVNNTDFRPADHFSIQGGKLAARNENAAAAEIDSALAGESLSLADHAGFFDYSRHLLKSGELEPLAAGIRELNSAAARAEADNLFATIEANGNLSDAAAQFTAGRGNLITGASAIDSATVQSMITALSGLSTGTTDLHVRAQVLLVPVAYELAALALNEQLGGRLTVYADGRLDAAYLMANPAEVPAFAQAFLNGRDSPTISSEGQFGNDSVRYKAIHDFGSAPVSYLTVKVTFA